jgi:hypothetical protein
MILRSVFQVALLWISTGVVNVQAEVWGHKLAQVQRLQAQAAAIESSKHDPTDNHSKDDYRFLNKETQRE